MGLLHWILLVGLPLLHAWRLTQYQMPENVNSTNYDASSFVVGSTSIQLRDPHGKVLFSALSIPSDDPSLPPKLELRNSGDTAICFTFMQNTDATVLPDSDKWFDGEHSRQLSIAKEMIRGEVLDVYGMVLIKSDRDDSEPFMTPSQFKQQELFFLFNPIQKKPENHSDHYSTVKHCLGWENLYTVHFTHDMRWDGRSSQHASHLKDISPQPHAVFSLSLPSQKPLSSAYTALRKIVHDEATLSTQSTICERLAAAINSYPSAIPPNRNGKGYNPSSSSTSSNPSLGQSSANQPAKSLLIPQGKQLVLRLLYDPQKRTYKSTRHSETFVNPMTSTDHPVFIIVHYIPPGHSRGGVRIALLNGRVKMIDGSHQNVLVAQVHREEDALALFDPLSTMYQCSHYINRAVELIYWKYETLITSGLGSIIQEHPKMIRSQSPGRRSKKQKLMDEVTPELDAHGAAAILSSFSKKPN